ncbi:hypothetical protein [Yersinia aldovae]|uniref:hypothetical protein n=1 Tax=Yersinia aldovae TaxID=29483 RepID=UPI0011AA3DE3|nr:hypothetical protein [Yersinia aldovae]
MNISNEAKERLKTISWFSQVGNSLSNTDVILLNSKGFLQSIESIEWENTTLEARNEITGFLAKKYSVIYQEWNSLADDARNFVENIIIPSVPQINSIDMDLLFTNMKWELVNYLMEDAYKNKLRMPLFFSSLVSIYELGHIPCGWVGNWPKGQLVIY